MPSSRAGLCRLFIALTLWLGATHVSGGDANGGFAVKGAGAAQCSRFVDAYDKRDKSLGSFGGWIEGFMSATNQHMPDTFDLTPWQGIDVLAYAVAEYCRKSPKIPFHTAVRAMVKSLHAGRLTKTEKIVVAKHADKAVLIYQSVLDDVRRKLRDAGLMSTTPTGEFDPQTASALQALQKRAGKPQTGVPDQATLVVMFAPKK